MRTVRVGGHQRCMTDSNRRYTIVEIHASSGLYCILLIAINSYKNYLLAYIMLIRRTLRLLRQWWAGALALEWQVAGLC
jgi:hypothetical protein